MEKINWDEILENLKTHNGTIKEFCEKNNVSKQKLYYKRKQANMVNTTVFHEVKIPKTKEKVPTIKSEIKVIYGDAEIYLPMENIKFTVEFIKELAKEC